MKKVLLLAAVAVSFTMVSCKKDYTCTCTYDGSTATMTFKTAKKKDAETACETQETNLKNLGEADASCTM